MPDEVMPGGVSRVARLMAGGLPSIDWALWKLTGVWATDGEMIHCPLPSHEDSSPSFNLWGSEGDGIPMRFGCFGCDRKGDVIDLIREIEGLEGDALAERAAELAREEARDTTTPERTKRVVEDARDLNVVLAEALRSPDYRAFIQFMTSKGLEGEDLGTFALDEWGWTAFDGKIIMPHRDRAGVLTGLKYRAGERKWNERGSSYPALYGAWRDHGHPHVVLCEGESDTLWASWNLRDEPCDVFGLPSGAQQEIREEWLADLTDRELILVFDGDRAGMDAARRWHAVRPDALLARLPEGEDLLSCGIPVTELVERAAVPRQAAGSIVVAGGVFAKVTTNGNVPVSDFAFQPVRELFTTEGPAWEGYITGDRNLTLLRASDLHSGSTITRWANRHGRAWTGGSGPAVQGVFNWLCAESAFMPLERAVNKAGKIGRSYVGPGFCIGPDRIRYIPPALGDAKLEAKLHIADEGWDTRALIALEQMNDPGTMTIILGWLAASLMRGEHAPAPPLFVAGESGAGKTNLLSTVLGSFGFGTEVNLTTTTPYGVDCIVNSSVGFPVWFDEYRGGAREDSMLRLRQLLRDAYYGQPSMKGGMTQQATELTEVTTWAGIIVSGEMSSQETSHRDRMVMLDLDPSKKSRPPYEWLQDRRKTAGLGHAFLTFLSTRPEVLFNPRPKGPTHLPERFRDTLGFVQAGWEAWRDFRWANDLRDTPPEPNWDMLSYGREQSEDPWLEALKACEGVPTRSGGVEIVTKTENGYQIIPSEVIVEARRVGIELPARANELVSWLKRRYDVQDTRVFGRRAKLVNGLEL